MKKGLLFVAASLFAGVTAFAQTTVFEDNFDSYSSGDYLAEVGNSDFWTTWSDDPGSAEDTFISDAEANTAPNSFIIEGESSDIILKLGNKTSGIYEVTFKMFIAADNGGYFNVQHYQAPGVQWAYDVFFGNDGNGYMTVNSQEIDFTHPNGTWFDVVNYYDLDNDEATLTINGTEVNTWPFHYKADGDDGINQLGGFDFFATAPEGQTCKYYVDDLVYTQVESGLEPADINVDLTPIDTYVPYLNTVTESVTVTNDGEDPLTFITYATYPEGSVTGTNNGGVINYDGDVGSAIGNPAGELEAAALFAPSAVEEYAGMFLESVDVHVGGVANPTSFELRIYEKGNVLAPGPGEIIDQKSYDVSFGNWNHIVLDEPIYLDGSEISIGYFIEFDGSSDENYAASCDAGPTHPSGNSDWIKSGPSWRHLTESELPYNWNIRGNLTGNGAVRWIDLDPSEATVEGGMSTEVSIVFGNDDLEAGSTHSAFVNIRSNDVDEEYTEIPVSMSIFDAVEGEDASSVSLYPNPSATGNINVKAENANVTKIEVYNTVGQLVRTFNANTTMITDLQSGSYIIRIHTDKGIANHNAVVN